REDLFVVVHEQFMTETAQLADIVLPAAMFLEYDDYYTRGGHNRILFGPRLMDSPGEARANHEVVNAIALRMGLTHPSFSSEARDVVAETFRRSGYPAFDEVEKTGYVDLATSEEHSRHAKVFAWPDGRFRFAPEWEDVRPKMDAYWVCD